MATKPDFLKNFQKIGLQFKKNALYLTLENLIFPFRYFSGKYGPMRFRSLRQ